MTHTQNILSALNEFLKTLRDYTDFCDDPNFVPSPDLHLKIRATTVALVATIRNAVKLRDSEYANSFALISETIFLAARFMFEHFTDSDVDSICDVEYDIHCYVRALDPTHVIPDDVSPACVLETIYPHPPEND